MSDRELSVVAGALARALKPKALPTQDALARRWRLNGGVEGEAPSSNADVIPLLDGWIRRLERQAGADVPPPPR